MSLHVLPAQAEVYQEFDYLPDECRPAWVVREDGATLVTFDPRTIRREACAWSVENLTEAELNYMRAAFDVGPVDTPCPDWWLTDDPVVCYVPPTLRLSNVAVMPRRESA